MLLFFFRFHLCPVPRFRLPHSHPPLHLFIPASFSSLGHLVPRPHLHLSHHFIFSLILTIVHFPVLIVLFFSSFSSTSIFFFFTIFFLPRCPLLRSHRRLFSFPSSIFFSSPSSSSSSYLFNLFIHIELPINPSPPFPPLLPPHRRPLLRSHLLSPLFTPSPHPRHPASPLTTASSTFSSALNSPLNPAATCLEMILAMNGHGYQVISSEGR